MKKIMFLLAFVCLGYSFAAAQTEKGSWLVEANTGHGSFNAAGVNVPGNTGIFITAGDGFTSYAFGGDAGYFVADDLAVKVGLGYVGTDGGFGAFGYKVGAKYYINGAIPVGADFFGYAGDIEANWVGLQGGYAIFVSDNVSIEPGIRYNLTIDDAKADSFFQGNIGFALHFD